jgi:hypothetical protein
VEHRLDGERGDVGGADDVADGEGGTQLGPAFLESISEWRADNRWWTKLANEVGTARVEVARCSLEPLGITVSEDDHLSLLTSRGWPIARPSLWPDAV